MGKEQTEPDFAKIVRVDGHQVLFYREYNGDTFIFNQIAEFRGVSMNVKLENIDPKYADKWFEDISSEDYARKLYETIKGFLTKSVFEQPSQQRDEGDSQ